MMYVAAKLQKVLSATSGQAFSIAIVVILGASIAEATSVPYSFTYQGKLYDAAGSAINDTVELRFDIFDPTDTCLLYSEKQTIDVSSANPTSRGFFSAEIGTNVGSTRRISGVDPSLTMLRIFDNSSAITGAASCSYTPTVADGRKLKITIVKIGASTVNTELLPLQAINAQPFATIAQTLGGKAADGFIQVTGAVTQSKIEDLASKHTELMALALGTSSVYAKSSDLPISSGVLNMSGAGQGVLVPNTPAGGTSAINKNYTDAYLAGKPIDAASVTALANGESLRYDGSKWMSYVPGTGTVTSVTAGTGLTGGTFTTSGSIAADFGTAAGKIAEGNDARIVGAIQADGTKAMAANLNMQTGATSYKIINLLDPTGAQDAATRGYVLSALSSATDSSKLPLTGGTLTGNLSMNAQSQVRYGDSTSAGFISHRAPTTVTSYTLTWPSAVGTANQVLTTDASGNLSWTSPSGSYADANARAAISGTSPLSYNSTTGAMSLGTVGVANGGTGATTLTSGALVVGNGTSAVGSLAGTATGNVIYATSATTWASDTPDNAGLVTKAGAQTVAGAKTFSEDITLNAQKAVRYSDSDSSNYVEIRAPATVGTNVTLTLPVDDGTANQVLTTDGNGVLTWTSPSGSYADANARAAISGTSPLSYNSTTGAMSLGTVGVANGGTGATTLTSGALVVGAGTGAVTALAGSATGNVLYATSATTWGSDTPDNAGLVTKAGAQTITGAKTFTANLTMNAQTPVRYGDSTSAGFISHRAPTSVTSYTLTWPSAVGTANQVLTTDASGNLSWTSPAGSYTDANARAAISGTSPLSYNSTTGAMSLGTVGVANGGTGATTLAANQLVLGNGTSAVTAVAAGTSGQMLVSQGASAPTWANVTVPTSVGATGTILRSNGTSYVSTTATYPATATTIGSILRADGTNFVGSTASYPNTIADQGLLFGSGTNVVGQVTAPITQQVLLSTISTGAPVWSTGSANTFMKGGAGAVTWSAVDLASADVTGTLPIARGGTNNGSLPVTAGGVVYTDGSKLMNVGAGTSGQFLTSNAAGAPTWTTASTTDSTKLPLAGGTMTGALVNNTNSASTALAVTQSGAGYAATLMGGNVGIGTTAPGRLLELALDTPMLRLNDLDTALSDGEVSSGIEFSGSDSNATPGAAARILAEGKGTLGFTSLGFDVGQNGGTLTRALHLEGTTGNVGIGTTTPTSSAILDVVSTTKGFLVPRMTTAQRTAISGPAAGLQVYDTDLSALFVYNGAWTQLAASGATNLGSVTGTLAVANGGTGATTLAANQLILGNGTSAVSSLAAGTAGQILRSAGGSSPAWSTATYPATAGTAGKLMRSDGTNFLSSTATFPDTATPYDLLYASGANTWASLAKVNTGALVTSSAGVPSWASGATANRVLRTDGTTVSFGQVAAATDISGTLAVSNGGTGTTTGSITGTGALTFAAGGSNQNVTLTPSGTGYTLLNGLVGIGDSTPSFAVDILRAGSATYASTSSSATSPFGSSDPVLRLRNSTSTLGSAAYISFSTLSGGATNSLGYISSFAETSGATSAAIAFGSRNGPNAYQEYVRIGSTGNVGIGDTTPSAKLEVTGQVAVTEYVVATGGTVDFNNGNNQVLSSVGGTTITVSNMVPGGIYNLYIDDTAVRQYSISGCTTTYWSPASGNTSGRSVFTIYRRGTSACYVTWATGFN